MMKLVRFHLLEDTTFLWRSAFLHQTDGLAMGSPLAPVVAEIFMQHLERCLPPLFASKEILMYKRYVDGTFCVAKKQAVDNILHLELSGSSHRVHGGNGK